MEELKRDFSFLQSKPIESAIDTYRKLASISNLLFETQSLLDTLTEDPFGIFSHILSDEISSSGQSEETVSRIRKELVKSVRVVEAERCRLEKVTRNEGEVEILGVGRLSFLFTREEEIAEVICEDGCLGTSNEDIGSEDCSDEDDQMGGKRKQASSSLLSKRRKKQRKNNPVSIHYEINFLPSGGGSELKRERLLVLDIYSGAGVPGEVEESEDMYDDDDKSGEDRSTSGPPKDRFASYVEPDTFTVFANRFLDKYPFEFSESDFVYFLCMFKFFELEWDIVGFVVAGIFGGEGEGIGEGEGEGEENEEEDGDSDEDEGASLMNDDLLDNENETFVKVD